MTDTGKSLAAETVRADGCKIFESLEFRGGKPFAEDRQVIFLWDISVCAKQMVALVAYIDTAAIVCDLEQF